MLLEAGLIVSLIADWSLVLLESHSYMELLKIKEVCWLAWSRCTSLEIICCCPSSLSVVVLRCTAVADSLNNWEAVIADM